MDWKVDGNVCCFVNSKFILINSSEMFGYVQLPLPLSSRPNNVSVFFVFILVSVVSYSSFHLAPNFGFFLFNFRLKMWT